MIYGAGTNVIPRMSVFDNGMYRVFVYFNKLISGLLFGKDGQESLSQ
jgi:hypothetical protein